MSWGRAFLSALGPALVVGPLAGIMGGVLLMLAIAIGTDSMASFTTGGIFALVAGAIFGLIIGSPISAAGAAIMLKLAANNEKWATPKRWAACGAAIGFGLGLLIILLLSGDALTSSDFLIGAALMIVAITGLGALSAYLCWRMLRRRVRRLNEVDTSVFE